MSRPKWENEVTRINSLIENGHTIEQIGKLYGVSKQRMYQVMTKFGISTGVRERKNFLRDKEPKYYWLNHMLTRKEVLREERLSILASLEVPDFCPMLGCKLNYEGVGSSGWTREDNSPSIDRVDSSLGYTIGNIQIISWRANRIKNDSTPEELMKIALYMQGLKK